jgi:ribosomal protein S18 acetylase RimI-like enzyme
MKFYPSVLGFLATHPDARGKGCASLLLQWGIQEAERHEAKIYLEATPMADGLYRKYQFYEVDEIKLSLVEYGKEETLSLKVMLRDSFMALEKGKGLGIR